MDRMTKELDECVKQFQKDIPKDVLTNLLLNHIRDKTLRPKILQRIYGRKNTGKTWKCIGKLICWLIIPCILSVSVMTFWVIRTHPEHMPTLIQDLLSSDECLLSHNEFTLEVTRPLFNCSVCAGLTAIPTENKDNLTKKRFKELYAYTGLPLLVKGQTRQWEAYQIFSFEFLRNLYQNTNGSLDEVAERCQFFGYNTEYKTLAEVFNMSQKKANMADGKWYVGWSNCVKGVEEHLRRHYKTPDFMPSDSHSSRLDWIFMGGWGEGAPMHIDTVTLPSWQAQLSGKKTWTLVPSAECENICHTLQITLERGDMIFVDTNYWYHSTYIHPGEISITIGSEYD